MSIDLKDYKHQVKNIKNKAIEIFKDYNKCGFIEVFQIEVEKQLEKYNPSIMFYGVYNAGKSSIINALVGEEIAKVGDIPTTATIQSINWNGFTLVDTPGIVANDEHTEIAEQEIKRNDVILFVVDDIGTFENVAVSTAIVKIINTGKPIIVVVNQKEASIEGAYSNKISKKVIPKIIENIKKSAERQEYIGDPLKAENFCQIVSVNAFSAYTARTQYGKESDEFKILMHSSEIECLVSIIQEQLAKSDGINILKPCISIIRNYIEQGIGILENELIAEVDKLYFKLLKEIEQKKSNLYRNITSLGRNEIHSYGDQIYGRIMKGENIDELATILKNKLLEIIRNQFENANMQLENTSDIYKMQFDEKINYNILDMEKIKFEIPELEEAEESQIWDVLKKLPPIQTSSLKIPTANLIPVISSYKIWIPIISEIINLLSYKKKREEEQRLLQEKIDEHNAQVQNAINEKISAIIEVNNKIRTEIMKLENSFVDTTELLVDSSFSKVADGIKNNFNVKKQENNKLEQDIQSLKTLLHEIDVIEIRFN
ncbi:hypothetical protein C1H57_09045 [Clostridium sp. 2-1]|uniref:GTPase n=1 Tax=Clostridium TaxID=1485 RepID=UPI000CDB32F1|nr:MULTISPECIES: GTPase [Clostridium]MBN7575317.1 50S ribosome-binding GTPase [Clostridium beijerinckii]MBN7580647.1 50S ribosome-binding GTPase [Clostridium beijerinckii]MBN7585081.1 50S ribosome-binding GTPase [Clostridium beijerinckii]MBO0520991.1 50S ribosome-binding GTPase [Clostridium beijerinckii]POO91650.1 hypothetical protein C1H57_09045 [Clostridium sp. 2-1]